MNPQAFEGELADNVDVFGQTVDVWFRPRSAEVERRESLGVGAIVDHDCLRALMDMPEGMPLDVMMLDPATLMAIDALVTIGAVELIGKSVCRRAVPPVELLGFSKTADRWTDVQGVTLLRTHGPRIIFGSLPLAQRTLREIDPQVGVAVIERGGWRMIRQPGTRAVRPSWQRWAIAEATYGMWLQTLTPEW